MNINVNVEVDAFFSTYAFFTLPHPLSPLFEALKAVDE
jgi:hypothetical protein